MSSARLYADEVVIEVPRSPSGSLKRSRSESTEVASGNRPALSRIEQIKLQARRNAERDEQKRSIASSLASESNHRSSAYRIDEEHDEDHSQSDQDDEDDEELPDTSKLTAHFGSSPLSSVPPQSSAPSQDLFSSQRSRKELSVESPISSLSLPPSAQNGGPELGITRSRRSTAHTGPYNFKASLEPLSERRKKLAISKQSAAVQAKLIKKEDYRSSAHDGRYDALEKVLRDHRREQKRGTDVEGLTSILELGERTRILLEQTRDMASCSPTGDGPVSAAEEEEDSVFGADISSPSSVEESSSPLSSGKRKMRFSQELEGKKRENERLALAALLAEDEDDEEGEVAFNILLQDEQGAKTRRRSKSEEHKIGHHTIWAAEMPHLADSSRFPKLRSTQLALATLRAAFSLGDHETTSAFLASRILDRINLKDEDIVQIALWLQYVCVFISTSTLSCVAMQALDGFFEAHKHNIVGPILEQIPYAMIQLGAKEDVVERCFPRRKDVSYQVKIAKASGSSNVSRRLRRGERTRAVGRLLQIVDMVIRQNIGSDDQTDLFVCTLLLSAHQQIRKAQRNCSGMLSRLFESMSCQDDSKFECFVSRIQQLLVDESPASQYALLGTLPCIDLRSRAFQRYLATYVVLQPNPPATKQHRSAAPYTALADKIGGPGDNYLAITPGTDYEELEAKIQILSFAFNDLARQLVACESDMKDVKGNNTWRRAVGQESLFSDEENKQTGISGEQLAALRRLIESLNSLGNKIQDGKGAFLDRSRVKDQLQRLRLLLSYTLEAYGIVAGSNKQGNTASKRKQRTLDRFITKNGDLA